MDARDEWEAQELLAWYEEHGYRILNDGSFTRAAWGSGQESARMCRWREEESKSAAHSGLSFRE